MITRKQVQQICEEFFKGVISKQGPYGALDYQGHVTICFPIIGVPAPDYVYTDPEAPTEPILWTKQLVEFRASLHNQSLIYTFIFTYRIEKDFVFKFHIPAEILSFQSLQFYAQELLHELEEAKLLKLSPQEEYSKKKKELFQKLYSSGPGHYELDAKEFMLAIQSEIEALKWTMGVPEPKSFLTPEEISKAKKLMEAQLYKTNNMTAAMNHIYNSSEVMYMEAVAKQQAQYKQQGTYHGSFKPAERYDNAGTELAKVVPALSYRGINCPEEEVCRWSPINKPTLADLIIHLNDQHGWPRSGTDPNPHNKRNIADWIDEVCLLHNLDQSFHPQEKKKDKNRIRWLGDKVPSKNKKKKPSPPAIPVVVDEDFLDKMEKNYLKKEADKELNDGS